MIKPDEFNSKLEELFNEYNDTYEMYDYLDKSRDQYIEENRDFKSKIESFKRSFIILYCAWLILFILFLIVAI